VFFVVNPLVTWVWGLVKKFQPLVSSL